MLSHGSAQKYGDFVVSSATDHLARCVRDRRADYHSGLNPRQIVSTSCVGAER